MSSKYTWEEISQEARKSPWLDSPPRRVAALPDLWDCTVQAYKYYLRQDWSSLQTYTESKREKFGGDNILDFLTAASDCLLFVDPQQIMFGMAQNDTSLYAWEIYFTMLEVNGKSPDIYNGAVTCSQLYEDMQPDHELKVVLGRHLASLMVLSPEFQVDVDAVHKNFNSILRGVEQSSLSDQEKTVELREISLLRLLSRLH